ncbi:capsular polysaccharide biosynthesis protein [Rossellomorea marisflavi]|uniref:Capsular polysaccharide biosynthesis protein n=1 Tax=Rossellomorea marisflavi TaxID=189381 RepID=A0A5D4RP30_9BACI|nr:capsular polysaccharide biosynthesis protein [Rossellomorea marisflavi]TYS52499.1 capsular polysaccharide biosynthesis protein [Rossellomorea marisflavi]
MDIIKKVIKRFIKPLLVLIKTIVFIKNDKATTRNTVAYTFRVSGWKQDYVKAFLSEYDVRYVPFNVNIKWLKKKILRHPNKVFIVWGFNEEDSVREFAKEHDIQIYRLEDGFVRSSGLGSMHTLPYSLCLDKRGMYFDSSQASDLEDILNNFNFLDDPGLLVRAKKALDMLKELRVSKYNHIPTKDINEIYGEKKNRRILVIGQVEDDASIKKGCNQIVTNNDIVFLARKENPEAEIFYKPHPDVLTGRRPMQSNPKKVVDIAKVIEEPLSLIDSFETIDHVYTITSLSGFEALIRGISVTTIGAPFYSGWGLTDDRQMTTRRRRSLSVEELFAAAYIIYPRYLDPINKEPLTLEETIKRIKSEI